MSPFSSSPPCTTDHRAGSALIGPAASCHCLRPDTPPLRSQPCRNGTSDHTYRPGITKKEYKIQKIPISSIQLTCYKLTKYSILKVSVPCILSTMAAVMTDTISMPHDAASPGSRARLRGSRFHNTACKARSAAVAIRPSQTAILRTDTYNMLRHTANLAPVSTGSTLVQYKSFP